MKITEKLIIDFHKIKLKKLLAFKMSFNFRPLIFSLVLVVNFFIVSFIFNLFLMSSAVSWGVIYINFKKIFLVSNVDFYVAYSRIWCHCLDVYNEFFFFISMIKLKNWFPKKSSTSKWIISLRPSKHHIFTPNFP